MNFHCNDKANCGIKAYHTKAVLPVLWLVARTKTEIPCSSNAPALNSEFQINMDINETETSTPPFIDVRSVIRCPHSPNFIWDFNETSIHWILSPITFFASLATIFLNALVLLAVKQKRELKKTSTILLSSMAIADLLVGAISMPLTVTADVLIIRQVSYSGFCTLRLATECAFDINCLREVRGDTKVD